MAIDIPVVMVHCDGEDCDEKQKVELNEMAGGIPLFGIDEWVDGLDDWEISESSQYCPNCVEEK